MADEHEGNVADAGTPTERLLYALGQLYRLYRRGELHVVPVDFDVLDLARIIGVRKDIELVSEEPHATAYHFTGEVLALVAGEPFAWRVMRLEEWVMWCELEDFAREHGFD